jgi:3-deoxy-7-phosphoheptulonate synthase
VTLSLSDTRVLNTLRLTSPQDLCANLPASESASSVILEARESIREVLAGRDPRPIVIVGPPSTTPPGWPPYEDNSRIAC